ncbi:MAG: hypothetical protein RIQ52_1169 [Pseudomonadota bacterium]
MNHVMPTYGRQPTLFTHGEGSWLWDEHGQRYLDAISGIAVCSLGHAHPEIAAAIADQAGKLIHTSNLYRVGLQEKLADRLCGLSGMDSVFFCNSGAEANEAAIKIARRQAFERGIENPVIVVMQQSFHGRTLATLSATGNKRIQEGFAPLVEGFVHVKYNDLAALEAIKDDNVVAILLEPVQGEGGVRVPHPDYLRHVRHLCDERGWLMMLDEVQTGMGRTGQWFAFQHSHIIPDVMTLAKALGNGVPIGACLARGKAATLLGPGKHGSTFGGNPLACRAALQVTEIIEREHLVHRADDLGRKIREDFARQIGHLDPVLDIRGRGLMIGIELDRPCAELVNIARDAGILINVTADSTIRLLPPLVMTDHEATLLVEKLSSILIDYFRA